MKFKTTILIIILCGAVLTLAAQNNKKNLDSIKIAEAFIETESFDNAITFYKNFLEQMPNDAELNFKLGFCLLNTPTGKDEAVVYLTKATNIYKKRKGKKSANYIESLFYLGRAFRATYKYEESLAIFNELKESIKNKKLLKEIDIEIKLCKTGTGVVINPANVVLKNLGDTINTSFSDHSPVFSADESVLMFTSRRPNESNGEPDMDGVYDEDIWISEKIDSTWTKPSGISSKINSSDHEATIGLSIDGLTLLIYKGEDEGSIYMSRKIENEWEIPAKLGPNINTYYRETHASLSADGKYLYFTSDRPGTIGGLDIWVSEMQENGAWGTSVNLGQVINTELNEESPYIHPDGKTLYFSSEGHETIGGYDIFKSVRNTDGKWLPPTNIGYPINTVDDDVYYLPTTDGKRAYFSSQRKGGKGGNDIYEITLKDEAGTGLTVMIGKVFMKCPGELPFTQITVTDNETGEEFLYTPNPSTGKFVLVVKKEVSYTLIVYAGEKIVFTDNILVPIDSDSKIEYKDIRLDPKSLCDVMTANDTAEIYKDAYVLNIQNVLFKYDQNNFPGNVELDSLSQYLLRNRGAVIEVGAYADSKGKAYYNYILSERRANSIKKYLMDKGVKDNQIEVVGYGEENPLTYNKINGIYNSESQNYNRRAEFRVIKQGEKKIVILGIKGIPDTYRNPYYETNYKKKRRNDIETDI